MITLFCGSMGAGKTYEAVKYVILPNLKLGRPIVTNIRGLDHRKIAAHLNLPEARIAELLRVIAFDEQDKIIGPTGGCTHDSFWPDEQDRGHVRHGDLLVLDEAWRWMRSARQMTPRLMEYMRMHRQWAGGVPKRSCEIVLISQDPDDINSQILNVTDRIVKLIVPRFAGLKGVYLRGDYANNGLDSKPVKTTVKRDPAIYPLYQSHAEEGVQEEGVDARNVFWKSQDFFKAAAFVAIAVVLLGTAGVSYFTGGSATASSAVVGAGPIQPNPSEHVPTARTPLELPNFLPSGAEVGSPASAAPISLREAPAETEPTDFVVMPLRGDPDAVARVTAAFCTHAKCQVVVEAAAQQVVVIGNPAAITQVRRLLAGLGDRAPGQMVQLVIFEEDATERTDIGGSIGSNHPGFRFSAGTAGHEQAGVVARLSVGQFSAALAALRGSGRARVISAPSVVVWPGQKAQVTAGLQVPVLGQIVIDASGRTQQGIDYRDSGVLLELEQLSAGERPVLRTSLEVSSFQETEVGVRGNPSKSHRTITTVAEVPPCQVVVLGGMDRVTEATQTERLPILNVPISRSSRWQHTRVYVALVALSSGGADACAEALSDEMQRQEHNG